jgi:hypothetical protein
MGILKAAGKLLKGGGKFLGPVGIVAGAGLDYSEGAQKGDRVRGMVKAGGGVVGGLFVGALGAPLGPVGVGVGGITGSAAGSEGATQIYDRFFGAKPKKASIGIGGITNSASSLASPILQKKEQKTTRPPQKEWRFGTDSPELAMGEMQFKIGQQALGNQRAIGMRNLDVEERLGLGDQYTQRAIAGTFANRDIRVAGIGAKRDVDVTRLSTGRDITVNRDQVRGMVDVTRLNTGRDIAVTGLTTNRDIITNRDQVRGMVDVTRLNTGRDIQVAGIGARRDVDVTRLATGAQKYIAGSGDLKTRTTRELGLGDQYTQRYIGGSGDKRTQAMVDIAKIQAGAQLGAINASGANQMSLLDRQMRASQAEAMNARNAQAQAQREMMDYQRQRDKKQYDLQQFGLIASMYG